MPVPSFGERGISVKHFLGKPEAHGNGLVVPATLRVSSGDILIQSAGDFGVHDRWSVHKREVITRRRQRGEKGDFAGRNGYEDGIGDGRNFLVAGIHHETSMKGEHYTGIDLDAWRAVLAHENLLASGVPEDRLTILVGAAVNNLLATGQHEVRDGWNLACLPQAPGLEAASTADGIDETRDNLNGAKGLVLGPFNVDQYGLSLNAAYLRALRAIVSDGSDVQVTLSGRQPSDVRDNLFAQTGWDVREVYATKTPVRQDYDTGVAYVAPFAQELDLDRGDGFFEQRPDFSFHRITPKEAEDRRGVFVEALAHHEEGDPPLSPLNVYHNVYEYIAIPNGSRRGKGPVKVYEI